MYNQLIRNCQTISKVKPYDPTTLLLDIYKRNTNTCPPKDLYMKFTVWYIIAQFWELKHKGSTDKQIVVYPYNGFYSTIGRTTLILVLWVTLKNKILSKQVRHKRAYVMIPFI